MKANKNFLVLGIGNAQVDLLQHLRQYSDLKIHALSNTEAGRGRSLVNRFEKIDITDKESVLEYAKENAIEYIYSIGSDVAMPTVCWVAEQLGLKTFISSETAYLCNNKHLFREKLNDTYGSVPFEILDDSLNVDHIGFPAIVKPVDSQGQRGISVVYSKEELGKAYQTAISHSRQNKALMERMIDGPEVSAHAYLHKGEILFFLPSDRISWNNFDGGIIHKHIIPASISTRAYENILKMVKEITNKLKIENGPVYFQIKIEEDTPYLIEVTPRLDGCHMWRQIHKSANIDLLDITVKDLMGKPPHFPKNLTIKKSILEFLCQRPHEPFRKQPIDPNACYSEFFYREGDIVQPMNEKFEKCGYQIIVE
ncbi:phosphoribosylglycinamide synthetase, ATP-grasp (A) domain protein [Hydrogenimonas sp.]|nr:phosphoribosylglycinamide synthetase, ATP-grasp (A) domain protein [Hydrogenimonas sp.]